MGVHLKYYITHYLIQILQLVFHRQLRIILIIIYHLNWFEKSLDIEILRWSLIINWLLNWNVDLLIFWFGTWIFKHLFFDFLFCIFFVLNIKLMSYNNSIYILDYKLWYIVLIFKWILPIQILWTSLLMNYYLLSHFLKYFISRITEPCYINNSHQWITIQLTFSCFYF